MKNHFTTAFVMFLMVFALTGCRNNALKTQAELINKQCPIDLGLLGEVSKIDVEGNTLVYHVTTNTETLKVGSLKGHSNDVKQGILLNFVNNEPTLKQFLKVGCNLRYEYVDKTTGEKLSIDISNDELKKAFALVGNEKQLAQLRMENFVKTGKLQLPLQIDEITLLTDMVLEGDNMVYVYNIDEAQVNHQKLMTQKGALREGIAQSLKSTDPSIIMLVDALQKDHKGLIYRYVLDKSKESFDITFSQEELAEIDQK